MTIQRVRPAFATAALVLVCMVAALATRSTGHAQAENWVIDEFNAVMTVEPNGMVDVVETIAVDFGDEEKHGIFRDLVTRMGYDGTTPECPSDCERIYPIEYAGATRDGETEQSDLSGSSTLRIRLGDPDETISGKHTYVLRYRIHGALNHIAATNTDELYWNITGTWPVEMDEVNITVRFADAVTVDDASLRAACYEGYTSVNVECWTTPTTGGYEYTSTRPLRFDEQLTVVMGWPEGLVRVDVPFVAQRERPKGIQDYFELDGLELAGFGLVAAVVAGALARLWWIFGRDREYTSVFYLTNDPTERIRPLFGKRQIVVEYTPPENLRAAQMGVLLDETADTLDVTATIIDLAVRGYIDITELPKTGLFKMFAKNDWRLRQVKEAGEDMLPYERTLFAALFSGRTEVDLSDLRTKFHTDLAKVKSQLYDDAMKQNWFRARPEKARTMWIMIGVGIIAIGVGLAILGGIFLGRGLIFVPVALGGLVLVFASGVMPRRTAHGSEALRRVLGFRKYVDTAETRRQEFNERQNIFAEYLPYAIVFGCVDKWAKAFRDMGLETDEALGWYHATGPLRIAAFSAHLNSFSNSIGSAMSSTPGSSGGSGFSGGSAGGGGGGGGGGSW